METPVPAAERALEAARLYEREYVPTVARPLAYSLLATAQPRAHERVLDLGCGTGVVARTALEAVGDAGDVTGLDPNPAMLHVARTKAPEGFTWILAEAEDMPLDDDTFTLAVCLQGLQYFRDRRLALAEVLRVLAPAGRFAALTAGRIPPYMQAMADVLGEHVGPVPAAFISRIFELDSEAVGPLLDDAGFRDVTVCEGTVRLMLPPPANSLEMYIAATPLADMLEHVDDDTRHRLSEAFVERCSRMEEPTRMALHYAVTLGSKG